MSALSLMSLYVLTVEFLVLHCFKCVETLSVLKKEKLM